LFPGIIQREDELLRSSILNSYFGLAGSAPSAISDSSPTAERWASVLVSFKGFPLEMLTDYVANFYALFTVPGAFLLAGSSGEVSGSTITVAGSASWYPSSSILIAFAVC